MVNIEAGEVNDARVVLKSYISWLRSRSEKQGSRALHRDQKTKGATCSKTVSVSVSDVSFLLLLRTHHCSSFKNSSKQKSLTIMENFFHKITQAWAVYGSMKHSLQETSFSIHDGDTISLPLEINTKLHFFLPLVFRLTGHLWTCAWCSSPTSPAYRRPQLYPSFLIRLPLALSTPRTSCSQVHMYCLLVGCNEK